MEHQHTLIDNLIEERYEIQVDGHQAIIEYEREPGVIVLTHTYVPKALEGRGIASELTRAVLEDARAKGLQVDPQCSFISTYIRRHPEWAESVRKRPSRTE